MEKINFYKITFLLFDLVADSHKLVNIFNHRVSLLALTFDWFAINSNFQNKVFIKKKILKFLKYNKGF